MDETALCDSILQFSGVQSLPAAGNSPYVSVPATGGSDDAAAGELADQTPFKIDTFGGKEPTGAGTGSTTTASQRQRQHLQKQKEGLMRAFVGTKVRGLRCSSDGNEGCGHTDIQPMSNWRWFETLQLA